MPARMGGRSAGGAGGWGSLDAAAALRSPLIARCHNDTVVEFNWPDPLRPHSRAFWIEVFFTCQTCQCLARCVEFCESEWHSTLACRNCERNPFSIVFNSYCRHR